jgi:hypothetical protein
MSPLVLIVFAPVIVGGVAFVALLLGAAGAGAWESIEERAQARALVAGSPRPQVGPRETPRARAA